jgi:translation initiation factor IF-2
MNNEPLVASEPVSEEAVTQEQIAELRAAVNEMTVVADREERMPPWKTPEGKAAKARLKRNKRQRQARKQARRS